MNDLTILFTQATDHVSENPIIYGIIAVLACVIIFFTRPYSSAVIFYSIEISVYLFTMHTLMHVLVYLTAGFSNQTSMKNVFTGDSRGTAEWTTPWIRFWEREVYDPAWVMWFEIVVAVLILAAVRYYRPMKIQTKQKGPMGAEKIQKKPKPKKVNYDDDDDWGVATTRRYTMPEDFGKNRPKKR